jgi:hypothetical protein
VTTNSEKLVPCNKVQFGQAFYFGPSCSMKYTEVHSHH